MSRKGACIPCIKERKDYIDSDQVQFNKNIEPNDLPTIPNDNIPSSKKDKVVTKTSSVNRE